MATSGAGAVAGGLVTRTGRSVTAVVPNVDFAINAARRSLAAWSSLEAMKAPSWHPRFYSYIAHLSQTLTHESDKTVRITEIA